MLNLGAWRGLRRPCLAASLGCSWLRPPSSNKLEIQHLLESNFITVWNTTIAASPWQLRCKDCCANTIVLTYLLTCIKNTIIHFCYVVWRTHQTGRQLITNVVFMSRHVLACVHGIISVNVGGPHTDTHRPIPLEFNNLALPCHYGRMVINGQEATDRCPLYCMCAWMQGCASDKISAWDESLVVNDLTTTTQLYTLYNCASRLITCILYYTVFAYVYWDSADERKWL